MGFDAMAGTVGQGGLLNVAQDLRQRRSPVMAQVAMDAAMGDLFAGSEAELADASKDIRQQHAVLFWSYYLSPLAYSLVGVAMLVFYNARLPQVYRHTAPVDLDLFGWALVLQGGFSFFADVWARFIACKVRHPAYLADRLIASSLTVLTFYMALFCWPSTRVQHTIASFGLIGILFISRSAWELRRRRLTEFMVWHTAWHISIPLVALVWLTHTACPEFLDHLIQSPANVQVAA
mmetsp:Transcript_59487/g.153165  ORF Transcript_59487/g.153165 Transcript_59487/m.153165 type:complete len:235 (-) Transcript_59487:37-741(-)